MAASDVNASGLKKRLAAYAGAATAALVAGAVADEAQAIVVHSGTQNIGVAGLGDFADIDLDGNGTDDFRFKIGGHDDIEVAVSQGDTGTYASSSRFYVLGSGNSARRFAQPSDFRIILDASDRVTSADGFEGYVGLAFWGKKANVILGSAVSSFSTFSGGPLVDAGNTGFIGVKFDISGANHFGWIRLSRDADTRVNTIVDWAYEADPRQPIHVNPVPEPAALGLLALGAVGVAATRRRRRVEGASDD